MINKKTGFWIRFLARLLDFVFVGAASVLVAYLLMDTNGEIHFKEGFMFYVWSIITSILIFSWFILIPIITRGVTPMMWVLKIKIIFNTEKIFISIIRRELLFSLTWIFMNMMTMAVVNHTMIHKFSMTNQDNISYSSWEKLRKNIVASVGSIMIVIQFIFAISIFVRGDKKGLHDSQSKTWTVWINKLVDKPKEIKEIKIKPRMIGNNPVIWVNRGNDE